MVSNEYGDVLKGILAKESEERTYVPHENKALQVEEDEDKYHGFQPRGGLNQLYQIHHIEVLAINAAFFLRQESVGLRL